MRNYIRSGRACMSLKRVNLRGREIGVYPWFFRTRVIFRRSGDGVFLAERVISQAYCDSFCRFVLSFVFFSLRQWQRHVDGEDAHHGWGTQHRGEL